MILVRDISQLVSMQPASEKRGRHCTESDLGLAFKQAMVIEKGKIAWIGPQAKLPKKKYKKEISMKGRTVLPAFVECHTHSIFAGDRAHEFELRNQGVSYVEISKQGGGILNTVRQTRKASPRDLQKKAQQAVDLFVSQGVGTLEIKSGYALNEKDELKMLKTAAALKGPEIVTTFLGAHSLPPEFGSHKDYLQFLTEKMLPLVRQKKLSKRVDIYIEKGFFESDISEKFLSTAQVLGFDVLIHADQLTLSGGSKLALKLGAISADHVIHLDDSLIAAFGKSNTTAVLLPAADLYMKCAYPQARALIDAGTCVALATDYNPGTSPTQDLALVGLLARLEMRMSLPEVFCAYTLGAATALGLQDRKGALCVGMDADFASTEFDWDQFFYSPGKPMIQEVYRSGSKIYGA